MLLTILEYYIAFDNEFIKLLFENNSLLSLRFEPKISKNYFTAGQELPSDKFCRLFAARVMSVVRCSKFYDCREKSKGPDKNQ